MLTTEERALLDEVYDRLLELYVERQHAESAGDWEAVRRLKTEIDAAEQRRQEIRRWDTAGAA